VTTAAETIAGGAVDEAALPDCVTMALHALWAHESAAARMPREVRAWLIAKTLNDFQQEIQ
jgi:hypothetical protein